MRQWRLEARGGIGRTADNLYRLSAGIHATHAQLIGVGVRFSRDDLRHNHTTEAIRQRCYSIHLKTRHGEGVRQRLGIEVGIRPLPQPIFRENHAATSPELREKAQVVLKIEPQITNAVTQHRQALYAHTKGKTLKALGVYAAHL